MIDTIRDEFNRRITQHQLSYRQLEAMIGVSSATLCRYAKGATPNAITLEAIKCWLLNKPKPEPKLISQKRMKCGGKTFLITIEQIRGE